MSKMRVSDNSAETSGALDLFLPKMPKIARIGISILVYTLEGGHWMRIIITAFSILICMALTAQQGFALSCACCAEPGTYSISTMKPGSYQLELLHEMQFLQTANLYMTEADFAVIRGLDVIKKEFESADTAASREFDLAASFSDTSKIWRFHFTSSGRKTGSFKLPMPAQMLSFKADIHDGDVGGTGPLLYKEWRFKGTVPGGLGFLAPGIVKKTTYFLVFQGRGNNCDDVSDFTHWRLEISGPRAEYAYYGVLGSGRSTRAVEQTGSVSGLTVLP